MTKLWHLPKVVFVEEEVYYIILENHGPIKIAANAIIVYILKNNSKQKQK